MAKKNIEYNYSGATLSDLVAQPLIAVARAQNMLAKEQVKEILSSCFHFEDGVYRPVLLKMTLTRSFLDASKSIEKQPVQDNVSVTFDVPMITIFPISSLGLEGVDVDFGVDIVAQYLNNLTGNKNGPTDLFKNNTPNIECIGKINTYVKDRTSVRTDNDVNDNGNIGSGFNINFKANTLPLTKGLLEIINFYSNSFQISGLKENENPL